MAAEAENAYPQESPKWKKKMHTPRTPIKSERHILTMQITKGVFVSPPLQNGFDIAP